MRRKTAIALIAAIFLAVLGLVIALAISVPLIVGKPGEPVPYDAFLQKAEDGALSAAIYDSKREQIYFVSTESGKTIDDLPMNADFSSKCDLRTLWLDLDALTKQRAAEGKSADCGFAFDIASVRRISFFDYLPYYTLMLLLAIAIVVMLSAFVRLRRRNRTP